MDNELPELTSLSTGNCWSNLEENAMLWKFQGNVLPNLETLDLRNSDLEVLTNNSLGQLRTLNLEGELLVEVANNTLDGLEALRINCLSRMNFTGNSLYGLRELSIVSLSRSNLQSLESNQLPYLAKLEIVNGQFRNLSELFTFPALTIANLPTNNISVAVNVTSKMEQLYLGRNDIRIFQNNSFPVLQALDISYNRLATFNGNSLPAVR
jgi:hypothetical protein